MKQLPTLQGYALEYIWNEDDTACFFQALPKRTIADPKKKCKGRGKPSNELPWL